MEEKVKSFLEKIAMIESSGGKNINHKTMESGIHKGTAAIGRYGLMPNTIKEIIKREKMAGKDDVELELLEMLDPEELTEYVNSNPEIEDKLAKSLATRVLKRFPSEEQAAYAWNMGHNLTPEKIEARDYQNHPYVKNYQKYSEQLNRMPNSVETLKEPKDSDAIKLASQTGAPLPSFANESGKIPERQNVLEAFNELYNRRVNEINDAYRKGMQEDFGLTDEQAEGAFMRIDPMSVMGSIKNVGKIAEEVTNAGRIIKNAPSDVQKKILKNQELQKRYFKEINIPKDELIDNLKIDKSFGINLPASAEDLINPTSKPKNLNRYLTEIGELPLLKPTTLKKLPEQTYTKLPPVAEEESILKRLADSLNRKPGQ